MIYLIASQAHGEEWKRSRRASHEAEVKETRVLSHRRHGLNVHPVLGTDRVIETGPVFTPDRNRDLATIKRDIIGHGWPAESIEWEPTLPVAGGIPNTWMGFNLLADPNLPPGSFKVIPDAGLFASAKLAGKIDAAVMDEVGKSAKAAAKALGDLTNSGVIGMSVANEDLYKQIFEAGLKEALDKKGLTPAEAAQVFIDQWTPKTFKAISDSAWGSGVVDQHLVPQAKKRKKDGK